MCKDKNGEFEVQMDGLSFIESMDLVFSEGKAAMMTSESPQTVDWTKFKQLLAKFLEVFGPIIIPLILGGLTPKPLAIDKPQ